MLKLAGRTGLMPDAENSGLFDSWCFWSGLTEGNWL